MEFLYEQDFYKIREDYLKRHALFEDPEFPGLVTNDAFSSLMKISTIDSGSKTLNLELFEFILSRRMNSELKIEALLLFLCDS